MIAADRYAEPFAASDTSEDLQESMLRTITVLDSENESLMEDLNLKTEVPN